MICQRILPLCVLAVLAASAGADDAAFKQEDKPENLKALFELLHQTVHVKKDAKQAAALYRSLWPDEARLKKALKDGVPADAVQKMADLHKRLGSAGEADMAKLARADQKVVQVHGATTEEIAKYEKGSLPYKEFPGGTKAVAEKVLRPKMTFYEVEFLEPGKDLGMKFHLFYWDGKQWTMLGPVWRVLPREEPNPKSAPEDQKK